MVQTMNKLQEDKLKKSYLKASSLLTHFSDTIGAAFPCSLMLMVNSQRALTPDEALVFSALVHVVYDDSELAYIPHNIRMLERATGNRPGIDKIVMSLAAKNFIHFGTMKDGSIFLDIRPDTMIRAILRVPSKYSSIRKMRRFQ